MRSAAACRRRFLIPEPTQRVSLASCGRQAAKARHPQDEKAAINYGVKPWMHAPTASTKGCVSCASALDASPAFHAHFYELGLRAKRAWARSRSTSEAHDHALIKESVATFRECIRVESSCGGSQVPRCTNRPRALKIAAQIDVLSRSEHHEAMIRLSSMR